MAVELPARRLLPLVLDGTPVAQIQRMVAGAPQPGDFGQESGKLTWHALHGVVPPQVDVRRVREVGAERAVPT